MKYPYVATVSVNGLVSAIGNGETLITVSNAAQTVQALVDVNLGLPRLLAVTPDRAAPGNVQLTLVGFDLGGTSNVEFLLNGVADRALTMTDIVVGAGGSTLTAEVNVSADAQPGPRTVVVTTPGGRSEVTTSPAQTFTIMVNPVNNPPSFTKGVDQTVNEDAGPQTVAGWATNISAGPPDEADQKLTFLVSTTNGTLFSVAPAISADGTLTYTPATNANGSVTVTVTLKDDGGTANGGVDSSGPQTFTITVKGPQAPLVLSAVELSGGKCKFTWNVEVGRKYGVQYKASLGDAEWKDVALDIVATGSTASAEDNVRGVGQRFYRIVQVE